MDRTKVLLLFGGESSEHDVSISSARNVYAALDSDKYDTELCYIDRHGKWWLLDELGQDVDNSNSPQIMPVLGGKGFVTLPGDHLIRPDVILPVLHGANGEDGTVQGLAQLIHLPVVGCELAASAIAMDKLATKEILNANGIKSANYEVHYGYQSTPDFAKITMRLGSPIFVKPANAGSSVGVSKVRDEDDFIHALELAHRHDEVVLIEEAINGRELEVAVLGTPPNHKASGVGEITPGDDFYSYDAKYSADSHASVDVNPELDDDLAEDIRAKALQIYELLGCKGMARVDFIVSGTDVLVMEVNTLPGFTNISMYPKLWREKGMSYASLVEALIEDAMARSV